MTNRCQVVSLSAIARVVLNNKLNVARTLLKRCDLAQQIIAIAKDWVFFKRPAEFDAELAIFKSRALAHQRAAIEAVELRAPCEANKTMLKNIARRSRLWKAGARRLFLNGICNAQVEAVVGNNSMIQCFRKEWAPIFQRLPPTSEQQNAWDNLLPYVQNTEASWHQVLPPDAADFSHTAFVCKPSKPGVDTIPYSAWASRAGGQTLQNVFFAKISGVHLNLDFNQSEAAFTLKGESPNVALGLAVRDALNLRPLGLDNSDKKY